MVALDLDPSCAYNGTDCECPAEILPQIEKKERRKGCHCGYSEEDVAVHLSDAEVGGEI